MALKKGYAIQVNSDSRDKLLINCRGGLGNQRIELLLFYWVNLMDADVFPPVMNTSMKTIFKVVGVYAIFQLVVLLGLVVFGAVLVYGFGINGEVVKSMRPSIMAIGVVSTLVLLLVPVVLAGLRFHRFSNIFPNGESRLTLAMLIALVGCLFPLPMAALEAGPLIARLVSGNLPMYMLLFALVSVATTYMALFFIALIGIRIGLRLTKSRLRACN